MDFDLNIARMCLQASADAYVVSPTLESVLAHVLIGNIKSSTEGNGDNKGVIVAFRGTAKIRDWVTDLDCWRTKLWEGVSVHEGFWCGVQTVLRDLKDRLAGTLAPPKLYLTGHSLGGAIAMLCAWLLERGEFPVHAVYTFGQPRVGNRAFAKAYDGAPGGSGPTLGARTWRFVNQEDIVPRVPGVLAGYRHAGKEVFLPSVGPMMINASPWLKLISDSIGLYREWKLGRVALLADHFAKAYMRRLGMRVVEETETSTTDGH